MKSKIKKIIPYLLILIILVGVGFLGWGSEVKNAKAAEQCWVFTPSGDWLPSGKAQADCNPPPNYHWGTKPEGEPAASAAAPKANENVLQKNLPACGVSTWSIEGCLVRISYYIFFALPARILAITANFFNAMLGIALSSKIIAESDFISGGWEVVRDLSNIFFILILLYIAIQIILDMGGHDAKKMIAKVIIIALLINFSMFFTKVVIDSTNILALIFYNKILVQSPAYEKNFDPAKTGVLEKDIGGSIASAFNIGKFISEDLVKAAETHSIWVWSGVIPIYLGSVTTKEGATTTTYLSIIFMACVIFLFASYAFFITAISFLGRLIELWVLIVFSPFAFMSFSVPLLSGIDYIGWGAWLKRLLAVSFMAPIFMFFLYLISKLIQVPFWTQIQASGNKGFVAQMLFIIIPAAIILTLLLQATKFAKKGSGVVGEKLTAGLKMAGGIALGAATGGAAMLGTATLGRAGAALANSKWAKERESQGKFGSTLLRSSAKAVGSGSFDLRGVKIAGKSLASATGMNLGEARKGGFTEKRAEQVKKRQERAKELEVGEDETLKQNLNAVEKDLQDLLRTNAHELEMLDRQIKSARENAQDANSAAAADPTNTTKRAAADAASQKLADLKGVKKARKSAGTFTDSAGTTHNFGTNRINGHSIDNFEDTIIPDAKHEIETENRNRKHNYAEAIQTDIEHAKQWLLTGGQYSPAGAKEAAHKIIMEVKLDSGAKH